MQSKKGNEFNSAAYFFDCYCYMIKQFYDIRSVVFARPYKNLPSDWFPSARFGFIPTQIF